MRHILGFLLVLALGYALGGYIYPPEAAQNNVDDELDEAAAAGRVEFPAVSLQEIPETNAPTVAITVLEDPMSGWNVRLDTTNFEFSPEGASTDHVLGQGHAHIYVNGVKLNRVYSNWYHIATFDEPGEQLIQVDLNANNHRTLGVNGVAITDEVTIEVTQADLDEDAAMTAMMGGDPSKMEEGAMMEEGMEMEHDGEMMMEDDGESMEMEEAMEEA